MAPAQADLQHREVVLRNLGAEPRLQRGDAGGFGGGAVQLGDTGRQFLRRARAAARNLGRRAAQPESFGAQLTHTHEPEPSGVGVGQRRRRGQRPGVDADCGQARRGRRTEQRQEREVRRGRGGEVIHDRA